MARAKKSDPTDPAEPTVVPENLDSDPSDEIEITDVPVRDPGEPMLLSEPIPDAPPGSDPVSDRPVRPAPAPEPPRRGVFLPLVFGGALAAGLGAAATLYIFPNGLQPVQQVPDLAPQFAALSERIEQAQSLAESAGTGTEALRAEVAAQSAQPDLAAIQNRLAPLETALSGLESRIAALDTRLASLEKRPTAGGGASSVALDAFQREMDGMRAEIAASKAELDSAAADAAGKIAAAEAEARKTRDVTIAEARQATARAALSHMQAALETGAPIESAIADLTAAGVSVPAELSDQSAGVPSLASLRAAFPDAARDALALSLRDTAGDGLIDRTLAFLRSQSGARSLSPRAGDDPDAVLSRSEAALNAGDLAAAIAELSGLPESGKARMAEWIGLAQRRLDAMGAVASLADSLN